MSEKHSPTEGGASIYPIDEPESLVILWTWMRLCAVLVMGLAGCGGVTAEHPLTVPLGLSRADAAAQLRRHQYCPRSAGAPSLEVFPRCERPGAEWGESWVTARFDRDRLVELRRYERFADDARAVERWNQLIAARARTATETEEATATLRSRPLEPGTRSVKVFRGADGTLVAVYLLTPTPPERASVLEMVSP